MDRHELLLRGIRRIGVATGLALFLATTAGFSANSADLGCGIWGAAEGLCASPGPTVDARTDAHGVTLRGDQFRPGSGGVGERRSDNAGPGVPGAPNFSGGPAPVDPDVVVRDGYTVTEPVRLSDLVNFSPVSGVDHMEPNGWIIVGLDTNFYAVSGAQVQSGELLGRPASVLFTPVRYRWSYGDGTTATLGTPGSSWAAQGKAEFDPTATSHVYRTAGDYAIDLTVYFAAQYRYTSTQWIPIAGLVAMPANRLSVTASEAKTVLVGRECSAVIPGPGC